MACGHPVRRTSSATRLATSYTVTESMPSHGPLGMPLGMPVHERSVKRVAARGALQFVGGSRWVPGGQVANPARRVGCVLTITKPVVGVTRQPHGCVSVESLRPAADV